MISQVDNKSNKGSYYLKFCLFLCSYRLNIFNIVYI